MNTLQFLILKKLVKRSPKSTRVGIIQQLSDIHPATVGHQFDAMMASGMIRIVTEGNKEIVRISTDTRHQYPDVMAKIQKELDNEK